MLDYFGPNEEVVDTSTSVDPLLIDALLDDLNTPLALMRLREMYRLVKTQNKSIEEFVAALNWIGIRNISKPGFFHPGFDTHLLKAVQSPRKLNSAIFLLIERPSQTVVPKPLIGFWITYQVPASLFN